METEALHFKALSDSTRLRLAVILALEGELCVCKLCEALAEPEYKISRHLGILRSAGMVEARRQGTWSYYSLCPPANPLQNHLHDCLKNGFITHPVIVGDLRRLRLASCSA